MVRRNAQRAGAAIGSGRAGSADAVALQSIAGGEIDAVAGLYDRHSAAVFGLALRIVGDRGIAEDVVQEVFIIAWTDAARFDASRGSSRAWLMGIAHHRAVSVLRQQRDPQRSLDCEDGPPVSPGSAPDVWTAVSARVDRAAVQAALASLPGPQRRCIELAYFGGFTQREIAATTGVPLGTVKGRVRLALLRLRELLPPPDTYAEGSGSA